MKSKLFYLICSIFLLAYGCRREDKIWDNNFLVPIMQADMSLKDMITDSTLRTNGDGSYNLVYQYKYEVDSVNNYLTVPDTLDTVNVKLQSLVLDNRSISDTVTLREIDPTSALFHGQMIDVPASDVKDAGGAQELDVSEAFFQTASFKEGWLDVTIHNDLPVHVEIIVFQLTNKSDGALIVDDEFTNIAPFSSSTKSISLAGKKVNGVMIGKVLRIKTSASTEKVKIDANKGLRIEMKIRDLKLESATAIFPAQALVSDTQEVIYRFGGPEITTMKAKTGFVKMKIFSTIEEEIIIDYSFPFSGENGDWNKPFTRQYVVPPAAPGTTQKIEGIFPLDNFVLNYQGKDPKSPPFSNTVYSRLTARTVYSGKVRNLSLDDYVYIEFGLIDIVPYYAFGDFGTKTFTLSKPLDITALSNVLGTIDIQDVNMFLTFENNFGIEALIRVNAITGKNTRTNQSMALTQPDLIGEDVFLKKAIDTDPLTPRKSIFSFNSANSNIESFLELLPNQIIPDIKVVSRPNGFSDFTDYIFHDSYMRAKFSLEMPVTFAMHNLQFVRKKNFNLRDVKNYDRIKSGTFRLNVENDFPLSAKLVLEFLDDGDNVLTELFTSDNTVAAAAIPAGLDKTTSPSSSVLVAKISESQMDMLHDAKKVRVRATFDTPGNNRTKIFDSYQIKTKLIGDFIYESNI